MPRESSESTRIRLIRALLRAPGHRLRSSKLSQLTGVERGSMSSYLGRCDLFERVTWGVWRLADPDAARRELEVYTALPPDPRRVGPPPVSEPTTEREQSASTQAVNVGGEYTADQTEFIAAVTAFQKRHKRKFLAHTDYLTVAVALGYRREKGSEVTT